MSCHSKNEHDRETICGCESKRDEHEDCGCGCSDDCGCSPACECGCGEQRSCCCCGGHNGFRRRFKNKAEVIAELEAYLAELKAEVQGVEERLADLRR